MKTNRQRRAETAPASPTRLPAVQAAMLCMAVFLSPLVAGRLSPAADLAVQSLVFVTALLWLIRGYAEGRIDLPRWRDTILVTAFFVFVAASAVDTVAVYFTLRELLSTLSYLLVFLMVVGLSRKRRSVYGVLASLVISAALVGVLGLKEFLLTGSRDWRTFSTFFNPDFLAGFMAMMLPLSLAWYLSRTSRPITLLSGLSVLLISASLLLSGSRFGALTAAGGILVFITMALIFRQIGRAHLRRAAFILLPLLLVFLIFGSPLVGRVSTVKAESHSGGFRIYTWKGTARMAAANPLNGTGLGTFAVAYPKHAIVGYTRLAHNSYLQLAAEAGFPAAVTLVLLLGSCTLPTITGLARRRAIGGPGHLLDTEPGELWWIPENGLIVSGLLGAASASMARNMVDSDWYVVGIGIGFWAILGAGIALSRPGEVIDARPSRLHAVAAGIIPTSALLLALAMMSGAMASARGDQAWMEGDPEYALQEYHLAATYDPTNAEHKRRLGVIYSMKARATDDPADVAVAEKNFLAAVNLEPTYAKNYYQLGRFYQSYGRDDDTLVAFKNAVDRHPNAIELLLALADAYESSGQNREALVIWRRMAGLEDAPYGRIRAIPELVEPEYAFARAVLGRELEERGDAGNAVKEYERALERIDRYQRSMVEMRPILDATGRGNPAVEERAEALKADLLARVSALNPQSE